VENALAITEPSYGTHEKRIGGDQDMDPERSIAPTDGLSKGLRRRGEYKPRARIARKGSKENRDLRCACAAGGGL
jgi:hypothetical protein